jgi:phage shock protein A
MLDDIFVAVYESPDLAASRQQGLTLGRVKAESSITLSGTNQLILRVADPDPKRATLLVNLWAQAITDRLNTLYGSSSMQVVALQQQAKDAQQQWHAAENALVEDLPQSKVDSLSAQLAQAQAAYNSQLAEIHSIDMILSDGGALSGRLAAQQPNAPVRVGDALGLVQLQQRASGALSCNLQAVSSINVQSGQTLPIGQPTPAAVQNLNCVGPDVSGVQLSTADMLSGIGTVGGAQQDLKLLMDSLQAQQKGLQSSAAQMDSQLAQIHTQLESAQFRVEELETQRDLAKAAFGVLSAQMSSAQAEVAANGSVARVVGKAGPAVLVASKVVTNTLLVGVSAFIAVVVLIWLLEWWRGGNLAD